MEISVGAILEGNIKSITKFGAFVSLPGGRSGLVHISEIAHSYVADVKDFLTEGQEVKVKVVSIDEAGRIKKATPPPPRPQNTQRDRQGGGSRPFNKDREGAPRFNKDREGAPRSNNYNNGPRQGGDRNYQPRNAAPAAASQNAGPADFEARLKQFMQMSDSKLSDLRMTEKRSSRRSGHR